MTVSAPIDYSLGWRRFEAKAIPITVLDGDGEPVDCSALSLEWLLLRQAGDASTRAYLTKTSGAGIAVSGVDNNICTVTIDVADYDDIPAGYYWHELWDRTSDAKLAEGLATLGQGTA